MKCLKIIATIKKQKMQNWSATNKNTETDAGVQAER